MAMMDKLKSMLKGHEGQSSRGVDKVGDMVGRRTRGKHSRHVGTAQERLKDQLGRRRGGHGGEPPRP
ncbi:MULTISPECIES: antitoxin [Streptomyces]|uniref:Kanamycin biosynthetic protein n=2 Tax=Streptomyces TaxID=1883 RepID=A0A100Y927_9ACTN|nr:MULTISPECIES: antitoxin [Streptomyces]KUH39977.1 kanamycin biosynthetic protein [Streptomyces kanasensis]UUS29624.1 antitoxin [Streptomyces changanensis]